MLMHTWVWTAKYIPKRPTKKLTMFAVSSVGKLDGLIKAWRRKRFSSIMFIWDSLTADSLAAAAKAGFSGGYFGSSEVGWYLYKTE